MFSSSEETQGSTLAKADPNLSISIISLEFVHRLGLVYTTCQHDPVKGSQPKTYMPIGKVELRWHKEGEAKSYPETFYIVESTDDDVILGRASFSEEDEARRSLIHTLALAPQTAGRSQALSYDFQYLPKWSS